MKYVVLSLAAAVIFTAAQPVLAQDASADDAAASTNGTTFRGLRVEGNLGGDRFQSEGDHNDKFGYGAEVGFDGTIKNKFVLGAEASYWDPGHGNENCRGLADGTGICHKAFQEWGAAVRAGVIVSPTLMIYGKAGYVNGEQRRRIDGAAGGTLVYDHYRADGYQVGGGAEYTLTPASKMPVYVSAQYVYSNYHGDTARQRLMGGVGVRFK